MDQLAETWCQNIHVVQLARHIVRGARTRGDESERIREWVKTNIEYRMDPAGHELLQDPIVTLAEQAGDCDDMACLSASLLMAIGHECEALGVAWKGEDSSSHAVCHDITSGLIVDPVAWVTCREWPPPAYTVSSFERA
jgi:transglutaminase-like putative cysteine protease